MNEDWRLKRATELFGAPFPTGSNAALPSFDRRATDQPDRRSAGPDRRTGEQPDRRTGEQPNRRVGDMPDRRSGEPVGRRSDDHAAYLTSTSAASFPLPPIAAPATATAAWPWRWRLLAAFLLVQTALIVWLLVGRPIPNPRVIFVTPPAAAPVAPAPSASFDATTVPPVASGEVPPPPPTVPPTTGTSPMTAGSPPPTPAVAASAPRAKPRTVLKRVPVKPAAMPRPAVPVVAAPVSACVPGSGPVAGSLCADPTLRRFDEQMQFAEAQVVAHGDRQLIALAAADRRRFARRRDKCDDGACLTRVYTDWIVALVKLLPAGAATPPICQPQQYTHTPLMNCWPWRLRETRKPFYSK